MEILRSRICILLLCMVSTSFIVGYGNHTQESKPASNRICHKQRCHRFVRY